MKVQDLPTGLNSGFLYKNDTPLVFNLDRTVKMRMVEKHQPPAT